MLSNVRVNGAVIGVEGMVIVATTTAQDDEVAESHTLMTEDATGVVTVSVCSVPGYAASVVVAEVAST